MVLLFIFNLIKNFKPEQDLYIIFILYYYYITSYYIILHYVALLFIMYIAPGKWKMGKCSRRNMKFSLTCYLQGINKKVPLISCLCHCCKTYIHHVSYIQFINLTEYILVSQVHRILEHI